MRAENGLSSFHNTGSCTQDDDMASTWESLILYVHIRVEVISYYRQNPIMNILHIIFPVVIPLSSTSDSQFFAAVSIIPLKGIPALIANPYRHP